MELEIVTAQSHLGESTIQSVLAVVVEVQRAMGGPGFSLGNQGRLLGGGDI